MSSLPANIRGHFLSWDRPWLAQVTSWLASRWNGTGPLDLSDTLAIVPTQQAGRRLREALAEFAAARNAAVFAPRVLTPDAWVKQDLGANVASQLQSLLAWTDVFRAIDLNAFREVFPVDPPVRNFPWALRLAQQFLRLQLTLVEAGRRMSDVPALAGAEFVEQARWNELAELEECHEASLAERQLRAPFAARIAAAENPAMEHSLRRIVVLAVPDLPPLAGTKLATAATRTPVDVVVFAPASEAAGFDGWGRPVPSWWERRLIPLREFEQHVHLCADPAAQAARVAALVASYAPADGVLAVGVADPEVTSLLENELERAGRTVFNPEGRPMRNEGLYALLSGLADLAGEASFATVEALARCPDFIAHLQSVHGREFYAVHWLKALDKLRANHLPVDLDAARAFAAQAEEAGLLHRGLETMHNLRVQLRSAPFATGIAGVLRAIFAGRHLDRARDGDVRFESAASAWTELLQECAEEAGRFDGMTASEWWELALRLYGEQRSSEEKSARALELQGWLELLWEDAPHLAVAGLNDGGVPESVPEDAFLPGSLRQRLGLATNAARFARDAYILQALAASRAAGGQLDLLFGKTAASGDPLRPSRLLLRCEDNLLPQRIGFLFRAAEAADASSAWTRAWKLTPRIAAPPEKVAVTALRRYLSCPFRFYLQNVLRMESVDPLKGELDALDFGTLCHGALERIGSEQRLRDCIDAGVLAAELRHHLDRAVQERYGKLLSLPLLVQIESAQQRLAKLAELQAVERVAGWEIISVEREFEIEIAGLRVRGKIDRIDRHASTGAVRVLDYKTSDTPVTPAAAHLRAARSGEPAPEWARVGLGGREYVWVDLQLPLYLRAVAADFPERVACGYVNLPKASGETGLALWEDYTIELHESAMRCAEGACAAIRRGEFWPPNEDIAADRDECAALFHHGVECSVEWSAR